MRIDTVYSETLVRRLGELVESSPEKSICVQIGDIIEVFFAVFDADYYQFDIVELLSSEDTKFSSLTDSSLSNSNKALINGAFWDLSPEKESRLLGVLSENVFGFLNSLTTIKSIPKGNTIFRDGKVWRPGGFADYHHNTKIRVNAGDDTRYYFYQTENGRIKFGKGTLPERDDLNSADSIKVGCDFLVGFVNKDHFGNNRIILDGDTDDWLYPENSDDFTNNFAIHSSNPNYVYPTLDKLGSSTKGFPLFGTINKDNREYLFYLVARDFGIMNPLEAFQEQLRTRALESVRFLRELGADNIFFTDGGTSAGFIYDESLVVKNSRGIKDPLIATAIGVKLVGDISEIVRVNKWIGLGGDINELTLIITLSLLQQVDKDQKLLELLLGKSVPKIGNSLSPQILQPFGAYKVNSIWNFEKYSTLACQAAGPVFLRKDGRVISKTGDGATGYFIRIFYGEDICGASYFAEICFLNSVNFSVGQICQADQIIGDSKFDYLYYGLRRYYGSFNSTMIFDSIANDSQYQDPDKYILPSNLSLAN
jgi:hypothetical protein